jgi:2-dehydropantoate 2-reductase
MTILIWGAGAIGGTVGAFLVKAGHDVRFVDIVPEHVAAIDAGKLKIEGPIEEFETGAPASLPEDLEGRFDRVFLCTKAQHTDAAIRQIATHLADEGYVVSLQNGLNEVAIARAVGDARTIGAFINFGADYLEPGRILYGGHGACVVGELDGSTTPRLEALHEVMLDFEPDAIITDNIWGYLWGKLGYGALLFATALTDESIADVLAAERYRPCLASLARELTTVASARHIDCLGFNGYDPKAFLEGHDPTPSFDAMVAHNRKSAKSHSGIWRDLAVRKRRTEVDPQLTVPLAEGRALGFHMPLTARLIELIHGIERGELSQAWSTLDQLKAIHDGNLA